MKLSKKQEKAIDTAVDVLGIVLSSGLDSDEDGSISEAVEELVVMKYKSLLTKEKEKRRREFIKCILRNGGKE